MEPDGDLRSSDGDGSPSSIPGLRDATGWCWGTNWLTPWAPMGCGEAHHPSGSEMRWAPVSPLMWPPLQARVSLFKLAGHPGSFQPWALGLSPDLVWHPESSLWNEGAPWARETIPCADLVPGPEGKLWALWFPGFGVTGRASASVRAARPTGQGAGTEFGSWPSTFLPCALRATMVRRVALLCEPQCWPWGQKPAIRWVCTQPGSPSGTLSQIRVWVHSPEFFKCRQLELVNNNAHLLQMLSLRWEDTSSSSWRPRPVPRATQHSPGSSQQLTGPACMPSWPGGKCGQDALSPPPPGPSQQPSTVTWLGPGVPCRVSRRSGGSGRSLKLCRKISPPSSLFPIRSSFLL